MDWTLEEVEAIVADYLHMLMLELSGQHFNKTVHRAELLTLLNQRSSGSIEFKHCNISAALIDLGFPYIRGYRPRFNYEGKGSAGGLLASVLVEQIQTKTSLDRAALAAVEQPAFVPLANDFSRIKTDAPRRQIVASEPLERAFLRPVKRDYLEREAANQSLGLAGEEFTVRFETWRLRELGKPKLADRIELVSQTQGDGLGYDVKSFEADGRERFIEVKTTTFGKETPFFVSRGELTFSNQAHDQFHLYRLYDFRKQPHLFDLPGRLDTHCQLDPITYRASFG